MNWALIAGGSKGLGLSIAKSLAKRKYNLILVARNQDDLNTARDQLQMGFNIEVEIFSCDLSITESADAIYKFCTDKNIQIQILCNAAGLGGSRDFHNLSLDMLRNMIRTNFESAVSLCHLFIPLLKLSPPAYILNVGSMSGFFPIPSKAVYSSSKSGLLSFSRSLRSLLRHSNISVCCACPGPLFTKPEIEKETIRQLGRLGKWIAVNPDDAGEIIIASLLRGKSIVIPGVSTKIISAILRIFPQQFVANKIYRLKKEPKE